MLQPHTKAVCRLVSFAGDGMVQAGQQSAGDVMHGAGRLPTDTGAGRGKVLGRREIRAIKWSHGGQVARGVLEGSHNIGVF